MLSMESIFESLENLNVSEECFEDIIGLVEEYINEVSFGAWTDTAKEVLPQREKSANLATANVERLKKRLPEPDFEDVDYDDKLRKRRETIEAAQKKADSYKRKAEHAREVAEIGDYASKAGEVNKYSANANRFLDLVKKDRFVRKMAQMGGYSNLEKMWKEDNIHNADPLKKTRKLKDNVEPLYRKIGRYNYTDEPTKS